MKIFFDYMKMMKMFIEPMNFFIFIKKLNKVNNKKWKKDLFVHILIDKGLKCDK
jgi:hypothetical protein